jgi:hypothetical protein
MNANINKLEILKIVEGRYQEITSQLESIMPTKTRKCGEAFYSTILADAVQLKKDTDQIFDELISKMTGD